MKAYTKHGFTLVELIVVIAILSLLLLVAIPVYSNFTNKAKESVALQEARITLDTILITDNGIITNNNNNIIICVVKDGTGYTFGYYDSELGRIDLSQDDKVPTVLYLSKNRLIFDDNSGKIIGVAEDTPDFVKVGLGLDGELEYSDGKLSGMLLATAEDLNENVLLIVPQSGQQADTCDRSETIAPPIETNEPKETTSGSESDTRSEDTENVTEEPTAESATQSQPQETVTEPITTETVKKHKCYIDSDSTVCELGGQSIPLENGNTELTILCRFNADDASVLVFHINGDIFPPDANLYRVERQGNILKIIFNTPLNEDIRVIVAR